MAGKGETVNLDTLSAQQLTQVKKQLDEELEHLTSSFTQLHAAQAKFRECLRCVQENKPILVPLTNSLYVRGNLTNASHVVVDDVKSAAQFYENKVGEVGGSVKELEAIVQTKSNNLRVVEEGS
ncbi:subunit of tubulin prefoldin [Diatrype stigma]|uniref:Subunit of tubulin prefoldin n=1 Tax=Diatrype stigma TaxID=117547 RepID=A0AAN9UYC6_9PEZI